VSTIDIVITALSLQMGTIMILFETKQISGLVAGPGPRSTCYAYYRIAD